MSASLATPFETSSIVAVATYNEKENLPVLLSQIRQHSPNSHILVIDDNSPDGTGQLAEQLGRKMGRVAVIHRSGKLGLGTAMVAAMKYALQEGFGVVVTMDADLSHDPAVLPRLLAGLAEKDVMIGSRYIPGGGTENWPLLRKVLSKSVNILVRTLHGLPARDNSGGYRAYRTPLLNRIDIDNLLSVGYSFQEEMLLRCHRAGAAIGETPIVFADRREGASKVNLKECARSLGMLLYLGVPRFLGGPNLAPLANPQKGIARELRKSA